MAMWVHLTQVSRGCMGALVLEVGIKKERMS
uniref:Uncharacterized protein n=1 Tax=Arundo donax TaxID=35708 RepID=A0A0A9FUJ2_ARUDO